MRILRTFVIALGIASVPLYSITPEDLSIFDDRSVRVVEPATYDIWWAPARTLHKPNNLYFQTRYGVLVRPSEEGMKHLVDNEKDAVLNAHRERLQSRWAWLHCVSD